jgi:hypothetical protein
MRVRRRNNRSEDFVREKIVVSVVKAGGNVRRARNIARQVERVLARTPGVTTEQIRAEVLNRLRERDARVYRSWLAYDRQNKRK